ncbi:MAG: hypothetical protein ABL993_00520 [Vicinamibacterales bacterium]
MLRTNLSTRPFYNVRAVRVAIGALGFLILGATIFNVVSIARLTLSQRTLGAHAVESEGEAARLRIEAAAIRSKINPKELDVVAAAAREANSIIDRRAFSWTALFAQFESTLPADVRITSVTPRQEGDGSFVVSIGVEARRVEDLDAFLEALETKSTFRNVLARQEETNAQGIIEAFVEGTYLTGGRQ